jgi:hypothetical protein
VSQDGSELRGYAYVEGPSLPLQGVDDVQRGDGLPLGVLGVGNGITDGSLKEGLQDSSGLC